MHEFFSFNFPLGEYFFCTSPAHPHPTPISFLMVRPLSKLEMKGQVLVVSAPITPTSSLDFRALLCRKFVSFLRYSASFRFVLERLIERLIVRRGGGGGGGIS